MQPWPRAAAGSKAAKPTLKCLTQGQPSSHFQVDKSGEQGSVEGLQPRARRIMGWHCRPRKGRFWAEPMNMSLPLALPLSPCLHGPVQVACLLQHPFENWWRHSKCSLATAPSSCTQRFCCICRLYQTTPTCVHKHAHTPLYSYSLCLGFCQASGQASARSFPPV